MAKFISILFLALSLLISTNTYAAKWVVPRDFSTIQQAIDSASVVDGDTIVVRPGRYRGATVTKAVIIRKARNKRKPVIRNGPKPWLDVDYRSGFLFPGGGIGSGATIKGLKFKKLAFPIFSRGSDDITIKRCKMNKPIQGITNWAGSRWEIRRNRIKNLRTRSGGGIAVFIGDFEATPAGITENYVVDNKIYGTVYVSTGDIGGYNGGGIGLYADFRGPDGFGAVAMSNNFLGNNKVSLISSSPGLVPVVGVELSEKDNPVPAGYVIQDNYIMLNRLGTISYKVNLSPPELANVNVILLNPAMLSQSPLSGLNLLSPDILSPGSSPGLLPMR